MATTLVSKAAFTDRIGRIMPSSTLEMVEAAAKLRAQGADILDLGAGEPHFTTPRHIKDAGIRAIEENFTKYTPVAGVPDLRRAIAERHRKDWESDYAPEEAMTTPGGKFALFLALQTLVQKGDEVIVPLPYWVSFPDMVRYTGATLVPVQTDEQDGFRLSARAVIDAITDRTRAIIINSPCNPSGAVIPADEYEKIVMAAHERGIYVINDECYVYLNYGPAKDRISAGRFIAAREHLVMIGSLSKTYAMTGWRSGFALAPRDVIRQMAKLQSQSTSSICAITQKGALAALTGPQECITEFRNGYLGLRDRCVKALSDIPQIHCNVPSGAFYAYPNVGAYLGKRGLRSTTEMCNLLLREAHVVTNPGDSFGTPENIRISYAVKPEILDSALARMKTWFEQQL
jgi:aspartate aminotransferase